MIKKLMVILVLLGIIGAGAWMMTRERAYSTRNQQALMEYQRGVDALLKFFYDECLDHMQQAVEEDPDFPLPYLFLAHLANFDERADKDQRLTYYRKLSSPADSWTPFERGIISLYLKKVDPEDDAAIEEQRREMEAFLSRYADHVEIFYLLLPRYQQLESDPVKLVRYYEKLHRLYPNNIQVLNQLGYLYVELGEPEKARAVFEKYVFIRPDEPNPYDSFGEYLYNTGQFRKAEAMFRKALDKKDDFILSRLHLSMALMAQGRIREAEQELDILESQPAARRALKDMIATSRFFACLNRQDLACMDRLVASLDSADIMESARLQMKLVSCLLRHDAACARPWIEKLKQMRHINAKSGYFVFLAWYDVLLGHFQEAVDMLKQIPKSRLNARFDNRNYVYYIWIEAETALGNRVQAEQLASELPPGFRDYRLMTIALRFNDPASAVRHARQVLKAFDGADPDFYMVAEATKLAEQGHHHQDPQTDPIVRRSDRDAAGSHR